MTKDLALLVSSDQPYLTTDGFLDALDVNLQKAMAIALAPDSPYIKASHNGVMASLFLCCLFAAQGAANCQPPLVLIGIWPASLSHILAPPPPPRLLPARQT